jgi:hypothetical protein
MTNAEIITAAVQAEALKHGIVKDAFDLLTKNDAWVAKMNGVHVENGEAVAADVKKLVAEMREKHPAIFVQPDARKLSAADFEKLEEELRKPARREIQVVPAYVRQIDSALLDDKGNQALREVLCGSKDSYYHGILEHAARSQGLNPTPAAA